MSVLLKKGGTQAWSTELKCRTCKSVGRYFASDIFLEDDDTFRVWCAGACGTALVICPPRERGEELLDRYRA